MRLAILIAALALPLSVRAEVPLAAYACGGCHGVGAKGEGPVAALAGRPKAELVAAMAAFRSNERPGTIMGRIARGYSEAEIEAIAAHLSAQR